MDRVLVEVDYPSTGRTYDFWIPKKMTIQTVIKKVSAAIATFENNPIILKGIESRLLGSHKLKKILNPADTISSAGIHSGDTLILI